MNADVIEAAFQRHAIVAFQFSGGRDSVAALYLLRQWWARMRVYHLDAGDQFPELRDVVEAVGREVPITVIPGRVLAVRENRGLASDVVPVDNSLVGRMISGREVKIISRYECCYLSLMEPMHERMRQDGATLIVRGQRDEEYAHPPMRSGDQDGGFEVLYPIQEWLAAEVDAYIDRNRLPVAPFYARGMRRAPECMGCTAWWDEGRAAYLRDYHPVHFEALRKNMGVVRGEIQRQLAMMEV